MLLSLVFCAPSVAIRNNSYTNSVSVDTSATVYFFQEYVARWRDLDQGCLRRLVAHNALLSHFQWAPIDTAMDTVIEQLIQSDLEDQVCCQDRTQKEAERASCVTA